MMGEYDAGYENCIDSMVRQMEDMQFRIDNLHRENAKLRELVRIADTYCVNGLCGKDDGCPLYLGKPYCAFPDRMRELGVDTCYLISAPQYGEGCQECSACGEVLDAYLFDGGRCPNCRAKVVDG